MKRWKKMMTVLVAFSLCLTSIDIGFPITSHANDTASVKGYVNTEERGINLVNNAGFEYGDDSSAEAWGKNDGVVVNQNAASSHSGTRCLKVSAGQTQTAYAFSGLNAAYNLNAKVKAGMWVYLSEASDAEKTLIVLERKENAGNILVRPEAKTGWQKVAFDGEAVSGCTEHVIKFEVQPQNAGDIYFDDAFVYSADTESINILRNPGFENDWDAFAQSNSNNGSITTEVSYDGSKALKITGVNDVFQASGWWPNKQSINAGEKLYFSVWVKGNSADGELRLRAEVKSGSPETVQNIISEKSVTGTTDWTLLYVEIPRPDVYVNEMLFHIETLKEGTFYVDKGMLSAVNPEPPSVSTEDKTQGNVVTNESSENAVKNPGIEQITNGFPKDIKLEGIQVNSDTDRTHSGAFSIMSIPGTEGKAEIMLADTQHANAKVRVTAYIWLGNVSDSAQVSLEYVRLNGAEVDRVVVSAEARTGWQKITKEIPALRENNAEDCRLEWKVSSKASDFVYLDDIFVEEVLESTESRAAGTTVTNEDSNNALSNNGFESGEESWGFVNASVQEKIYKTHSGSKAAVVTAKEEGGAAVWNVLADYRAGDGTKVTGYIWLNDAADAGKVHVKFRYEKDGMTLSEYTPESGLKVKSGWQKVEISVPKFVESDVTTAVLVVDVDAGTSPVYLDDFYVKKIEQKKSDNYVSNGDFEQVNAQKTEASNWGLMPGWDTVTGAIETTKVHGGNCAIKIPQGNVEHYLVQSSNWINKATTPEYDKSKPMLLTAYVYYENLSAAYLKIECKSGNISNAYIGEVLEGSCDGWKKVELYLPPTTLDLDEIIVGVFVTSGAGIIYVDDVSFKETEARMDENKIIDKNLLEIQDVAQSGFNWLSNPEFESDLTDWGVVGSGNIVTDTVHKNTKALKLSDESHIWNVVALNLDCSQELTLSFWVNFQSRMDVKQLQFYVSRKTTNDTEIERFKIYAKETTGWQKVSVVIPACKNPVDIMVIGADTLNNLVANVYLDDFYLTYRYNNPSDDKTNLVYNGSFEFGTDGKPLAWGSIPEYGDGTKWVENAKEGKLSTLLYAKTNTNVTLFQSTKWGLCPKYDYQAPLLLTAYVKTSALKNGCFFKVERKYQDKLVGDGTISETITETSGGWTKVELYAAPTDKAVDEIIVSMELLPGSGSVFVDAIRMQITEQRSEKVENSLLKNPGLEKLNADGSVLHWDVWPGTPEEGVRQSESVTDVVHSGERALKIELTYGNGQAVYQYRVLDDNPFDFNKDYEASVWINMKNVSVYDGNGVKLGVKRKDAAGKEYNVYTDIPLGSTEDWVQVTLKAPRVDADIIQYDVIVDIGSGSGVIYLDDFDLVETEIEKEAMTNLDFVKSDNVQESSFTNLHLLLPVAAGITAVGVLISIIILVSSKKRRRI